MLLSTTGAAFAGAIRRLFIEINPIDAILMR